MDEQPLGRGSRLEILFDLIISLWLIAAWVAIEGRPRWLIRLVVFAALIVAAVLVRKAGADEKQWHI